MAPFLKMAAKLASWCIFFLTIDMSVVGQFECSWYWLLDCITEMSDFKVLSLSSGPDRRSRLSSGQVCQKRKRQECELGNIPLFPSLQPLPIKLVPATFGCCGRPGKTWQTWHVTTRFASFCSTPQSYAEVKKDQPRQPLQIRRKTLESSLRETNGGGRREAKTIKRINECGLNSYSEALHLAKAAG